MNNSLSLYELNNRIKGVMHSQLSDLFWITAETSDVRVNQNGHCYLEFIEKDGRGKSLIAKARGMIWANVYHLLRAYFESTTKQTFGSGIKVLVKVSVEFHELYGLSLTVHDIDPSYTLGDQARNRAEILKQLEEDGVLGLNKELELPIPTQRIAIISSPTAAGYEDFCNQLENNTAGYKFYLKLFPSIMQGDRTEDSIIHALETIYEYQDKFDAVVIIRGGGATSDLASFDSYLLAASCAQFPLPIITGIGHERDETVLDIIAHTSAKTPTAVAEFLLEEIDKIAYLLEATERSIIDTANARFQRELMTLNTYQTKIGFLLKNWANTEDKHLVLMLQSLSQSAKQLAKQEKLRLEGYKESLDRNTKQQMKDAMLTLENYDKHLDLLSPTNVMKRGYSITLYEGKAVKEASKLKKGDEIKTIIHDGEIISTVK